MAASRIKESRAAESSTEVSASVTAGATSTTDELDSTRTADEELAGKISATEELESTIDELETGATDELDTALLLEDLPFDFLEAELAGALAEELAGATVAELTGAAGVFSAGATDAELAGTVAGALTSSSNSAKRSRTWPKETWARERPKNKGKIANLRI
jgi:hypothetical protein